MNMPVCPSSVRATSQVPFTELVQDATGAPLSAAALKRHLRRRYLDEPAPHAL